MQPFNNANFPYSGFCHGIISTSSGGGLSILYNLRKLPIPWLAFLDTLICAATDGLPLQGMVNMKKGFSSHIEAETIKNTDFRRVLYTGKFSQLVLMRLKPGEEIGEETHDDVDQFFRFEAGEGFVVIDGTKHAVKDGTAVVVPNGAKHNVVNTSKTADLKLYTIYSPPEHQDK